jgi:hypothetical protein
MQATILATCRSGLLSNDSSYARIVDYKSGVESDAGTRQVLLRGRVVPSEPASRLGLLPELTIVLANLVNH